MYLNNLIYPAIFEKENGGYIVSFPDLEGCITEGDTIEDAYKYAKEVLALHLDNLDGAPTPSSVEILAIEANQRIMLVEATKRDDIVYLKKAKAEIY